MNTRRTEILIRIALFVAILVVCLNAWLAFRSVRILEDSQYWVAHTWQVINALERVIGSVKDAETGYRGYLLTNNTAYLEPYTKATADIPHEFRELFSITAGDPQRQAQITTMRVLVEHRLGILQSGINRLQSGDTDKAGLLQQSGTGKM